MKLPDFTLDSELTELRKKMRADELGDFSTEYRPNALTLQELDTLAHQGIDVSFDDITRLRDGTLAYKDSRVLVYIRDVAIYGNDFELPKFHVAYCSTLERMNSMNRFGRYVVATRENGRFLINKIDGGRKRGSSDESLNVCQNCLNMLHFDGFGYSLSSTRRRQLVSNFSITRFFQVYPKSLHSKVPAHDYMSAPINEYTPQFSERASSYKSKSNWKCEGCDLLFDQPSDREYLHTHHKNALKYDDDPTNLAALCHGCHAEQPAHAHMKRGHKYQEFLRIYGQRWHEARRRLPLAKS